MAYSEQLLFLYYRSQTVNAQQDDQGIKAIHNGMMMDCHLIKLNCTLSCDKVTYVAHKMIAVNSAMRFSASACIH